MKTAYSTLFLALLSTSAQALDLPPDLLYNGKPIDSLCFFESESNQVDIKLCGIQSQQDRKITGQNQDLIKKGFIGYDYSYKVNSSYVSQGDSYYQYLGQYDNTSYLFTVNNSGGSGYFTSVLAVTRNDDQLSLNSIMGGDRCNGGIVDATINNNQLIITANLNAADYPDLVHQKTPKLEAYTDLAACAACCSGTAKFALALDNATAKPTLVSVDLGQTPVVPSKDSQGKYQYCFDTIVLKYQTAGKSTLNPADLQAFMKEFNQKCT